VILDAASEVFAARGEQASMGELAAQAGVARTTVYRYFPTRQALVEELARRAAADAAERLAAARIDEVAPAEGVVRAVRAFVEMGPYFLVLARERRRGELGEFGGGVAEPLGRLFERGQRDGAIRSDVPAAWLTGALVGVAASVLSASPSLGKEDTVLTIASLVLYGARVSPS
jgi:TetR/AcrR family transcriptional repressor of mexCD-oprJ operon